MVLSFEQQVIFGLPGDKPSIEGGTVVLVNFGTFPVEEVVLEQTKRPSQLLVDTVPAVRVGTLGPCQVATYESDEAFDRVVFVDVNGTTWSRKQASPPRASVLDPEVERSFPDIRDALPLTVTNLKVCG